jgi:hypothetical protein
MRRGIVGIPGKDRWRTVVRSGNCEEQRGVMYILLGGCQKHGKPNNAENGAEDGYCAPAMIPI